VVAIGRNEKGPYEWLRDSEPHSLAVLPDDLRDYLGLLHPPAPPEGTAPRRANGAGRNDGRVSLDLLVRRSLDDVSRGAGRNDAGFSLALQCRDNGYGAGETGTALRSFRSQAPSTNAKGQSEPYSDAEIRAAVDQAFSRGPRDPWQSRRPAKVTTKGTEGAAADSADLIADLRFSDLGNASLLVQAFGDDLRYVPQWRSWHAWDGKRWPRDEGGAVYRRAADAVRLIYDGAARCDDHDRRAALAKWALACENRGRLENMVALAQHDPAIITRPETFDADPWLLNVENGTLDLRTGKLREHRRADLISKLAAVRFDPEAKAPTFMAFLRRVFDGNQRLIGYVQKLCGYCLTGSTKEQVVSVWHGAGANGKSTAQNIVLRLLGEYGATTPSETLMVHRGTTIPNDIARLAGVRFAAAFETGESSRLNEGLVKQATGGDRLTARFLHAEFFEFVPQFKIVLSCNHKPRITGGDHGIWRRVHLVPFEVTIPEAERDRNLPEKLEAELPGVLNCLGGHPKPANEGRLKTGQ